jgi:hypothetical protein
MSEVKIGTRKKFGPYKGSEQNGGRPIYVWKVKTKDGWRTETKNKARADYEDRHGKLSKDTDVDHKNNKHSDDRASNLRPLKHGKNTAKENKRRAGKKENEK